METVKRQGDRISELEAQLKSDEPTDAKHEDGKFAMLNLTIECLWWIDGIARFLC